MLARQLRRQRGTGCFRAADYAGLGLARGLQVDRATQQPDSDLARVTLTKQPIPGLGCLQLGFLGQRLKIFFLETVEGCELAELTDFDLLTHPVILRPERAPTPRTARSLAYAARRTACGSSLQIEDLRPRRMRLETAPVTGFLPSQTL